MDNWQSEWPTEPGMYWFYGWCFKKYGDKPERPEMHLVDVHKVSNGIMCVTNGHFLYKEEGAEGVWLKATLPTPPAGVKRDEVPSRGKQERQVRTRIQMGEDRTQV